MPYFFNDFFDFINTIDNTHLLLFPGFPGGIENGKKIGQIYKYTNQYIL